jgi:hypothetical protein
MPARSAFIRQCLSAGRSAQHVCTPNAPACVGAQNAANFNRTRGVRNGSYCTPGARREPPPGWNPTHAPTHPSPHHRLRRLGTGWVPYPSTTHPSHHRLARRLGIPPAGYRLGTLPIHHITVFSAGWVPAGWPAHPSHHRLRRLGTGWLPAGYPTHPSHHRLARRLGIPPAGYRLGTGLVLVPYPSIVSPSCPPAGYRLGTLPIHHITGSAGWLPAGCRLGTGWVPYPSITSPACPSAGYPAGWVPAGYPTHPSYHCLVRRLGTSWVPYPSITSPAPPAGCRLGTGWVPYPSITSPACPPAGYPAGWVPAGYRLGTLPIHRITVLSAGWVPAGYPTHPSHHRLRRLGTGPYTDMYLYTYTYTQSNKLNNGLLVL